MNYRLEKMLNMIGIGLQMLTISVLLPYALYKTRMHIYINRKLEGVADQMIGYPIESSDQTLFWLCILMIVSVITIILAFIAAKNFKNRPKLTITLMFICAFLSLVTSLPAVVIWIIAGIKTINTYQRNSRSELMREFETSKNKEMDGFELGLLIASLSISILCIIIYALATIPFAMIIVPYLLSRSKCHRWLYSNYDIQIIFIYEFHILWSISYSNCDSSADYLFS